MKIKKYLAALLMLAMCFTLIPPYVMAADNVTFTAVAGIEDSSNEGYAKLFDGKTNASSNKWCVNLGSDGAYVIIKASKQVIVTGYTLTTANDNASWNGRNPKSWILSGCNDYNESDSTSGSWNNIDERTDDYTMQDKNQTAYTFTCDNSKEYQYYRLKITKVQGKGATLLQIGELGFTYEDPTYVGFTALEGRQTKESEGYAKLIDGNINTKWGVNGFSGTTGAYVIIKASKKINVTGYAFTTGNDTGTYKGRNPKTWTLSASNDYNESSKTGTWTEIDNVENDSVLQEVSHRKFSFDIDEKNVAPYQYFKLDIKANVSGDFMQLAEMEFVYSLCAHSWETASVTEATCSEPGYKIERCSKCNSERKTETAAALGHQFGDDGKCTRCGEYCAAETGGKYYTDLQAAVDEASSGATVTLMNNAEIASTLNISKDITLDLNGFTLKMTGNESVIKITGGKNFCLKDSVGSGKITGGKTSGDGGGVYIDNGTFNMSGGTIENCSAGDEGGGVYIGSDCTFNMSGGVISGCTAKKGGGVYIFLSGIVSMTDGALIRNCTASGDGGGIYIYGSQYFVSKVTMDTGVISGCTASMGGGIYANSGATNVHNSTIENCTATGGDVFGGGGIYANAGTITVDQKTVIKNNHAPNGGGGGILASGKSNITADDITVSGNDAKYGGGICASPYYKEVPTLKITNSEISGGNHATEYGGGICVKKDRYDDKFVSAAISGTQISENISDKDGGGVWIQSNASTISDSQIFGNNAGGAGGGVAIVNSGSLDDLSLLKLSNNTIGNNTAQNGGGIYAIGSNFTAEGGHIAANTAQNGGGVWASNSVIKMINGHVMSNTAANGGGMYLNDGDVSLTMDRVSIISNSATEAAGGISCRTGGIDINGGAQIYQNIIASVSNSETGEESERVQSNLCLYDGKTISVTTPETELDGTGYFTSLISVSVMDDYGVGSITSAYNENYSERYSEFFCPDNENHKLVYDNGIVYIGYRVILDCGTGEWREEGVLRNKTLNISDPERAGYCFGGWFVGENGYDITKPVTESFTLTAKWLKDGENGVSITPNKLYVLTKQPAKVYVGAYKGGRLTSVVVRDSKAYAALNLSDIGLDFSDADKVSAFMWTESMTPVCEKADTAL